MKLSYKRLASFIAGGLLLAGAPISAQSIGFADVPLAHIVGSGANKSGLVIDFNDGAATERYIFQYNWDGAAGSISGAEMLVDVAAGVPALSFFNFGTVADGFYLTEMTYGSQTQTNGDFVSNFDSWGYFAAGGTASGSGISGAGDVAPDSVASSPSTAGEGSTFDFGSGPQLFVGRFIDEGSWDVWSFGPYEASYAVPEVANFALIGGFASLLVLVRRRRIR